ncbi:hypothetical protein DUI87_06042 [Hirundo rustica rustica]|uniref:Uncharacterized protein n=1 Tax=Hirundo rustica rustica TaxID=333673 RepID=A0A3M0L3C6_HIRRU|nr:hypothetical protein DUI87_06042 [Hirundo rustica rustica]
MDDMDSPHLAFVRLQKRTGVSGGLKAQANVNEFRAETKAENLFGLELLKLSVMGLKTIMERKLDEEAKIKEAQKDQRGTSQQAVLTHQRQLISSQSPTLVPAITSLSANANNVTYPFQ